MLKLICNICNTTIDDPEAYILKMRAGKLKEKWGLCPSCWAKVLAYISDINDEQVPHDKFTRDLNGEAQNSNTREPVIEGERRVITVQDVRQEQAEKAALAKKNGAPTQTVEFTVMVKRRLTEEAVKYINEQTAANVSVAQIARDLGVSYATVYNHSR